MTLAEAACLPALLASRNLCVLGVAVAGDTMHAEFVPMSQCRHLAIVACVDSLCAIRTIKSVGVALRPKHPCMYIQSLSSEADLIL